MRGRAWSLVLSLAAAACGGNGSPRPSDLISDIPEHQQRTVKRAEFRYRWPFTVGTGTLACTSGAVVFRSAGRTYALNEAAVSRGFPPVEGIRQTQSGGPPTNPLKRLTQDHRAKIFAASAACKSDTGCRQRVRDAHSLSEGDLIQIEAEGKERRWPPLPAMRVPLEPIVEAGLKLCAK